MFSEDTQLHYTGATCKTETRGEDTTAVTAVSLVLDSLTPELARDLSDEIEDICFTQRGQIRDEIRQLKIRLREPQQMVTVKMAVDVKDPHVVLRNVRIPSIRVTKRGEDPGEEVERKSKKVAPTGETLRCTLDCLMLPEQSAEVRKWLTMMPGKTFFFVFENEAKQLDFGPESDDDEDAEGEDGAAQDDLDFGRPNRRKKAITDKVLIAQLAEVGLELQPAHLKALDETMREGALAYVTAYQQAREANATELPAAPDYLVRPQTLGIAPKPDAEPENEPAAPAAEKRARKPRGKFANKPRLVKGKK